MKKTFALFSFVLISFALIAQTHVPASKSYVGIWRQTGVMSPTGELINATTGNYKVINSDGTFYTFIVFGSSGSTILGLYGSYILTSDSTCTEHFIRHAKPSLNGKDASLRFRLADENTMISKWNMGGRWISEQWTRLQF